MGQVSSIFARKTIAATGVAVDQPAELHALGLDPDGDLSLDHMIPAETYYALLERLAKVDGPTPQFQLRAGASMRCEDYGAFGMAWRAAPTLIGSLQRAVRYGRLLTSVSTYQLQTDPHDVYFHLHRDGPLAGLHLSNEATLASVATICNEVTTKPFAPRAVYFKHAAPASVVPYETFFGCEVVFGADRNAFLLAPAALNLPNRQGDETLSRFFSRLLDQEIGDTPAAPVIEEQVRHHVSQALSAGLPRMGEVARALGMSERTLNRRLAERGQTFQVLVEQTRRQMAEQLLHRPDHSLAEVALLTGFSEQSAFSRAFKRWTGATPAAFRQAAQP